MKMFERQVLYVQLYVYRVTNMTGAEQLRCWQAGVAELPGPPVPVCVLLTSSADTVIYAAQQVVHADISS